MVHIEPARPAPPELFSRVRNAKEYFEADKADKKDKVGFRSATGVFNNPKVIFCKLAQASNHFLSITRGRWKSAASLAPGARLPGRLAFRTASARWSASGVEDLRLLRECVVHQTAL